MTAEKTGFVMHEKYANFVEYIYRGHKYMVEYATGMTYCCTAPKLQHEIAQDRINRMIDEKPTGKPIDLDEIFDMLGWD